MFFSPLPQTQDHKLFDSKQNTRERRSERELIVTMDCGSFTAFLGLGLTYVLRHETWLSVGETGYRTLL